MSEGKQVQERTALLEVRRNEEIFSADGGWFRARWHFSFSQYYDPENMGIGTLRVFNHDTLTPGAIWPMHHHKDVEGITYVLKGEFEHADSLGNGGVLYPGGVQRMTLGAGAEHSERNHSPSQEVQFLQMWILPSQPDLTPSAEQRQYSESDRTNRLLQILRPAGSDEEGLEVHQDARMFVSRLEEGASLEYVFAPGRVGYLYLIQGRLEASSDRLGSGDAAYVRRDGALNLAAITTCELILVESLP
jgi:quercetin 2,3-dioxygenase